MSDFRLGDRNIHVAGVKTRLRLTLAALAEMVSELGAETPSALAARLRGATEADWHVVLRAMADPRPTARLSQAELAEILPALSAVLADGLSA